MPDLASVCRLVPLRREAELDDDQTSLLMHFLSQVPDLWRNREAMTIAHAIAETLANPKSFAADDLRKIGFSVVIEAGY